MNKNPITRLNYIALTKLLEGWVQEENRCVIKFYSQSCHLCHELAPLYVNLANKYSKDIFFLAFNVADVSDDDSENFTELIELNGVPSFIKFKTTAGGAPTLRLLEDPETPDERTWYTYENMEDFIKGEF